MAKKTLEEIDAEIKKADEDVKRANARRRRLKHDRHMAEAEQAVSKLASQTQAIKTMIDDLNNHENFAFANMRTDSGDTTVVIRRDQLLSKLNEILNS